MKSGAIDPDRFDRQCVHKRKMPKNSVLNGGGESDKVNLAAYEQMNLCKMDNARVVLPCETDHIYANIALENLKSKPNNATASPSNNNNSKDLTGDNINIRELIFSHFNAISRLQETLKAKEKIIADLRKERDKLKFRLEQSKQERRMCLMRRRNFSKPEAVDADRQGVVAATVSQNSAECRTVSVPMLATRYFGRRSKTVPSRALKRRYMGPPKVFPTKQIAFKSESSATSISSTSEVGDPSTAAHSAVGIFAAESTCHPPTDRKTHKRKGHKSRLLKRKCDFLTTNKGYFLPDFRAPPTIDSCPEIYVPSWKVKPVTSFYQMEGTENINDCTFDRRHLKHEQDERRRKRWDVQRLREQKACEKFKLKQGKDVDGTTLHKLQSFYPDLCQIEHLEVVEQLPVMAFGHLIPLFQPCEFSLPWQIEDSSRRSRSSSSSPKVT